jgi:hypothetical protein
MDLKIKSAISTNVAEVSSASTLNINTPIVISEIGYVTAVSEVDSGSVTGSALLRPFVCSQDNRLRVGVDSVIWQDNFNDPILNNNKYLITQSGQTINPILSGVVLNSGENQDVSTSSRIQTFRSFPIRSSYPLYVDINAKFSASLQSNSITEFGLGYAVSSASTTDGIYFSASGSSLVGVVNYGGQIRTTPNLYIPNANEYTHYTITAGDQDVGFWADGVLLGRILTITAFSGSTTQSNYLPLLLRTYNSGAVLNPISFTVANVEISQADTKLSKKWSHIMTTNGQSSISKPLGENSSSGTTSANSVNNTAPTIEVPDVDFSNTITAYPTLGGEFAFPGVAQSETDYVLFAYQNPVGSQSSPSKTLIITDVNIFSYLSGATIETTATNLQWSIGVGGTAVDLTTTDSATSGTRGARKLALGNMSFPVGRASGGMADRNISVSFGAPLMVETGTYCHIIVKIPVATNTAGQVFKGNVSIVGYYE